MRYDLNPGDVQMTLRVVRILISCISAYNLSLVYLEYGESLTNTIFIWILGYVVLMIWILGYPAYDYIELMMTM